METTDFISTIQFVKINTLCCWGGSLFTFFGLSTILLINYLAVNLLNLEVVTKATVLKMLLQYCLPIVKMKQFKLAQNLN